MDIKDQDIKLIPVGSFRQNDSEVISLLIRKLQKGKLSKIGKEFITKQNINRNGKQL